MNKTARIWLEEDGQVLKSQRIYKDEPDRIGLIEAGRVEVRGNVLIVHVPQPPEWPDKPGLDRLIRMSSVDALAIDTDDGLNAVTHLHRCSSAKFENWP